MKSAISLVLAISVLLGGCRSRTPEDALLSRGDNPCTASHMRSHAECRNAFINSIYIENVKVGQTQDEVRGVMRKAPERREASEGTETWVYHTDYRYRLWTAIVFRGGRVTEIKQLDMRRRR